MTSAFYSFILQRKKVKLRVSAHRFVHVCCKQNHGCINYNLFLPCIWYSFNINSRLLCITRKTFHKTFDSFAVSENDLFCCCAYVTWHRTIKLIIIIFVIFLFYSIFKSERKNQQTVHAARPWNGKIPQRPGKTKMCTKQNNTLLTRGKNPTRQFSETESQ